MRSSIIAVAWLLAAAAPPAAAVAPACGVPVAGAVEWNVERDAASAGFQPALLCEAVQEFAASPRNLHGLVVERQGRLVAEAYREGADRSTYTLLASRKRFDSEALHDVRSVTKSIVALLWGVAEAEGIAPARTTPVLDVLPALADLRGDGRERVTVDDLLCMRSGLQWDEGGGHARWSNDERGLLWRGDRMRYVFDRPMAARPGTRFTYNGGSTAVLGALLEERTGMDLEAYARQKLFEPLGIRQWEWVRDLRGRTRAYTGLRLRPRDLARIGRLVLDAGRWQGRQVVPAAWVRRMVVPCAGNGDFGYHWWSGAVRVGGQQMAWHGALGNGGQRLFLVPGLDLVVVTTAGEYDDGSIGRVQQNLLRQVIAATRDPGPPGPAAAPETARETPPVAQPGRSPALRSSPR